MFQPDATPQPSTKQGLLNYHIYSIRRGGGLSIKINLQTRLLIVTRLVNEADIVNKTRPLFTLSLEMTRLVNETRLLLVPGVNIRIYTVHFMLARLLGF